LWLETQLGQEFSSKTTTIYWRFLSR